MDSDTIAVAERLAGEVMRTGAASARRGLRRLAPALERRSAAEDVDGARAALALAPRWTTGGHEDRALEAYDRAQRVFVGAGDADRALSCFVATARIHLRAGRFDVVFAQANRVERLYGRTQVALPMAQAHVALAHAAQWRGEAELARALLFEAETLGLEEGHYDVAAIARAHLAFVAGRGGDLERAEAGLDAAQDLCRSHGLLRAAALVHWARGWVSATAQDMQGTMRSLEMAARLLSTLGEPALGAGCWVRLSEALQSVGEPLRARRAMQRALAAAHAAAGSRAEREVLASAAVQARLHMDTERAERLLDRLAAIEALAARPPDEGLLEVASRASGALWLSGMGLEPSVWWVGRDGSQLRRAAHTIDLRRRGAARRAMACLARARRDRPGRPVPAATLARAAWPHGQGNVHQLVWTLRKSGLGDALVTEDGGYLLDVTQVQVEPP